MAFLAQAAVDREMAFLSIDPQGVQGFPTYYKPGSGYLALIGDDPDPDRDASVGPAGFSDQILKTYLDGAQTFVISAVLEEGAGAMLATTVATSPDPFAAIVITNPSQHAAWTRKIIALTGRGPRFHVAPEGFLDVGAEDVLFLNQSKRSH
jgi:hypothetical protein